jgi:hypothetical protein
MLLSEEQAIKQYEAAVKAKTETGTFIDWMMKNGVIIRYLRPDLRPAWMTGEPKKTP